MQHFITVNIFSLKAQSQIKAYVMYTGHLDPDNNPRGKGTISPIPYHKLNNNNPRKKIKAISTFHKGVLFGPATIIDTDNAIIKAPFTNGLPDGPTTVRRHNQSLSTPFGEIQNATSIAKITFDMGTPRKFWTRTTSTQDKKEVSSSYSYSIQILASIQILLILAFKTHTDTLNTGILRTHQPRWIPSIRDNNHQVPQHHLKKLGYHIPRHRHIPRRRHHRPQRNRILTSQNIQRTNHQVDKAWKLYNRRYWSRIYLERRIQPRQASRRCIKNHTRLQAHNHIWSWRRGFRRIHIQQRLCPGHHAHNRVSSSYDPCRKQRHFRHREWKTRLFGRYLHRPRKERKPQTCTNRRHRGLHLRRHGLRLQLQVLLDMCRTSRRVYSSIKVHLQATSILLKGMPESGLDIRTQVLTVSSKNE